MGFKAFKIKFFTINSPKINKVLDKQKYIIYIFIRTSVLIKFVAYKHFKDDLYL